ncbi:MAG TPA: alkaline phosphatase family protein [Bryobacteraceae bacterium]|nr:alkaline phosphatase family protein [Bryobacteraceae bacterium]
MRATRGIPIALLTAGLLLCGCSLNFVRTPVGDAWRQSPVAPVSGAHHFDRVLIIVLENQDYEAAIRDPYLGRLATIGANFTDFHGLFHPSYSNYLAMVAGKEIVTHFDRQVDLPDRTIADLLGARGFTWKNYAEGYPGNCFTGAFHGSYARKHVPFLSFENVQKGACDHVVDGAQFALDLNAHALPNYSFYSPDQDDDGHDPVDKPAVGLAKGSKWLSGFLNPLLENQPFMQETLTIVTYDESTVRRNDKNHIYTVFLGGMVKPGQYSANYNHYNVLRTIEDNFVLGTLADGDGNARPITGVWK